METWDDYERPCAQAREALSDFPQRPRDLPRQLQRQEAEQEYHKALKALQDYLTRRYGWGPGPTIQ